VIVVSYTIILSALLSVDILLNLVKTNIKHLTDLLEPYSTIVKQLSKLALQALNTNQLVFTYDQMKTTCPDIISIPEAINGFGLLQAVQHFVLTGKTMTFSFLHLTLQEYLAIHRIKANLQALSPLKVLLE